MLFRNLKTQFPAVALLVFAAAAAQAQQGGPVAPAAPAAPASPPAPSQAASAPAQTAPGVPPPQVVTVLHRLSGIKLMRWLNRSGSQVAAVVELDDESAPSSVMHLSVTAGFTLNDGESIITSLPQAEAEVLVADAPAPPGGALAGAAVQASSAESADLTVVRRDGFQFTVNYVGLDGLTGLSLLRLNGLKLPSMPEALEETLSVGQRLRLYAPERAGRTESRSPGNLYLRMGEIEGRLAAITRLPSGRVARLTVRAPNLSPSINGGVAINDAGETVGIVEATSATEARILPARVVRSAAARVLARRASVPRPLLGVRGLALTSASLFQLTSSGWSQAEAAALMSKGQGLLLTSVVPDTPAALADLRPGDIIVRINNDEVKNAEDFSYMLSEVGGQDSRVLFTVLRGQALAPRPQSATPPQAPMPAIAPPAAMPSMPSMPQMPSMPTPELAPFELPQPLKPLKPFAVPVELDFSFKFGMTPKIAAALMATTASQPDPLTARGAETIPLANSAALRRGARAGLLVVAVAPASQAERAGLREGDVIEAVNGQLLSNRAQATRLLAGKATLSLSIIRGGQKLKISLPVAETKRK